MTRFVNESLFFRAFEILIPAWIIITTGIFLAGIVLKNAAALLVVFLVMAPLGFTFAFSYKLFRNRSISRKTQEFANTISHIAKLLNRDLEPGISAFDELLSLEKRNPKKGPFSPSLIAVHRMLEHIQKYLVDANYGAKEKLSKKTKGVRPLDQFCKELENVGEALARENDLIIYKSVANLFFFTVSLFQDEEEDKDKKATRETEFANVVANLIEQYEDVSIMLLQGRDRFWPASDRHVASRNYLIKNMDLDQNNTASKWLLLISFWLHSHIKELQKKPPSRSRIWAGPSRILGLFLNQAMIAFEKEDFRSLTEIISESFDWRIKILRSLIFTR